MDTSLSPPAQHRDKLRTSSPLNPSLTQHGTNYRKMCELPLPTTLDLSNPSLSSHPLYSSPNPPFSPTEYSWLSCLSLSHYQTLVMLPAVTDLLTLESCVWKACVCSHEVDPCLIPHLSRATIKDWLWSLKHPVTNQKTFQYLLGMVGLGVNGHLLLCSCVALNTQSARSIKSQIAYT